MTEAEAARLRDKLRRDGVEKFFEDTMIAGQMDPRTIGLAFGINPNIGMNDDTYLQLLGIAVMRFFHKRQKLQQYNTIDDAANLLRQSKRIICITGAGISTSLGVPDFRSKGTGFYDKVREQGFNEAEEVFDITSFDEDPTKFFTLAGDLLPDMTRYTPTHAFIRVLQDQDRLLTNYTQNIDNLEQIAGIDEHRYIQCHGSFATASCRKCKHRVRGTDIFADIRAKQVSYCQRGNACIAAQQAEKAASKPAQSKAKSKKRNPQKRSRKRSYFLDSDDDDDDDADDDILQPGVMKPDIIFFGEPLPDTFFTRLTTHDAHRADLVLVIGTSLKVAPVSEMPNYIPHAVPHIYISKEPIRHVAFDVQLLGSCDDVVVELCRRAGFRLEHEMVPKDFQTEVRPVAGEAGHVWAVERKSGLANVDSESVKSL